jgi:2-isopropylmalate synthase
VNYFPEVRKERLGKLVAHHPEAEQGERYVFADEESLPTGDVYAIVRRFGPIKPGTSYIELHRHSVDSLWLFIGEGEGLRGLTTEITINQNTFIKESPASVWIPANTPHSYKPIQGTGFFVNFVLAKGGKYNVHTFVDPPNTDSGG